MFSLLSIFYLLCNNNFYTRTNSFIDVDMKYNEYFSIPIQYDSGFDMRYKNDSLTIKLEKEDAIYRINSIFTDNLSEMIKLNTHQYFWFHKMKKKSLYKK